ncbi:NAD-dependent epimerase/dehydratase family protein [Paenalkalicoccus suaedae]|uniref:NAD-dependent epimerase/dehydratase family protein n=1 Tax=Paenalkalicoccus suaedae TaxID=2592382 RepID=A0A859FC80_9BACI|nr:NAD-dependent epimerase/dehydratase family protein [Paenalkalicoccus suaedae]QKS70361.1 NAD-dependent epimerase/dehydratase family protein [Paenalkalicoccus suaedae]
MSTSIFVTGATGFVGRHLFHMLEELSYDVHIGVRTASPYFPPEKTHYITTSYQSIATAIEAAKPEVILHLASFAQLGLKANEIKGMIESNITLTGHLAEAAVTHGVRGFINTSSYAQFGGTTSYRPNSFYATTKQAAENILYYYSLHKDLAVVNLVLYDNYGENDTRKKLLNLIKQALINQSPLDLTPGDQLINLLHVEDVCRAFTVALDHLLTRRLTDFHRYSVMADQTLSLKALVTKLEELSGTSVQVCYGTLPYRDSEIMIPREACERLPGFTPQITLDDGLRRFLAGTSPLQGEI